MSSRHLGIIGVGALLLLVVAVAVMTHPWSRSRAHAGPGARVAAGSRRSAPEAPSSKQLEALTLSYPPSSGALPASIAVEYLDTKDRTRMTLRLKELRASATAAYRVGSVDFRLVSEFRGRERSREFGESVVDGSLSLMTGTPGALAVGSIVGVFVADGRELILRPASRSKPAYSSKREPGGASERVNFKIDTRDLIDVVNARDVSLRIGEVKLVIDPGQLAEMRAFVSRMRPGT